MRKVGIRNSKIESIKDGYYDDGFNQYELAETHNFTQPHISKIVNGKAHSFEDALAVRFHKMKENIIPSEYEEPQAATLRAKRNTLKCTKITFQIATTIRNLYFSGRYTQKELAVRFNLHQSTISRIILGLKWKNIQ